MRKVKLLSGLLVASVLGAVSARTHAASINLPIIDENRHAVVFMIDATYTASTHLLHVAGNMDIGDPSGALYADVENLVGSPYLGQFTMDVHIGTGGVVLTGPGNTQHFTLNYTDNNPVNPMVHTLVDSSNLQEVGYEQSGQPAIQLRFAQSGSTGFGTPIGVLLYFNGDVPHANFDADFSSLGIGGGSSGLKADVFATVPTPTAWAGGAMLMVLSGMLATRKRVAVE